MSWRWSLAPGFSAAQCDEPKYDVNQGPVSRTNYTYKATSFTQEAHMVTCCSMYWKKNSAHHARNIFLPCDLLQLIHNLLIKSRGVFGNSWPSNCNKHWQISQDQTEIWESAIKCCRALKEEWVCMLRYSAAGMRSLVSSRKWLVVRLLTKAGFQLVTDIQPFVLCCTCGRTILTWLNFVHF